MALLLLSLGLGLVCAQDFNPRRIVQRNYDISKVSGTWYSISMAASDRKRIEEGGDLRIFMEGIQVIEDGGLKLSFHFMLHAECTTVAMVCGKTGKSGEYTINWAAGSEQSFCADLGENSLRILEADYQRYVIWHMQSSRNGTASQVLALYGTAARGPSALPAARPRGGRFPELKSSFLDRFDKACKSHGLGPEKIIPFSNQGTGPLEHLF
ncbi:epididymal-specific lipocalin-9 [Oryx dammah]|uniref:epididymal-specific lipocalin-9 n=1 Tax=Oryx dammah TaxID=59534 RepID=UPI001A9C0B80|nr:epididymal-specific lipocalin-9 [Oryx dammah]